MLFIILTTKVHFSDIRKNISLPLPKWHESVESYHVWRLLPEWFYIKISARIKASERSILTVNAKWKYILKMFAVISDMLLRIVGKVNLVSTLMKSLMNVNCNTCDCGTCFASVTTVTLSHFHYMHTIMYNAISSFFLPFSISNLQKKVCLWSFFTFNVIYLLTLYVRNIDLKLYLIYTSSHY